MMAALLQSKDKQLVVPRLPLPYLLEVSEGLAYALVDVGQGQQAGVALVRELRVAALGLLAHDLSSRQSLQQCGEAFFDLREN